MIQWATKYFDNYPVEKSASLGTRKANVLGVTSQTQNDCLTIHTKGLLEFIFVIENTKRIILQTIGKIYGLLGLQYKSLLQHE